METEALAEPEERVSQSCVPESGSAPHAGALGSRAAS